MVATAEAERTAAAKAPGVKKERPRKSTTKPAGKKTPGAKREMSDDHKAALAVGRDESRVVGRYLVALEANKPKRGRKVTLESQEKKLAKAQEDIQDATGVERLQLQQAIFDLEADIEVRRNADPTTDITALQAAFVKVAKEYGRKKGITKRAFAALGVPADVLKEAGFGRTNAKAA